MRKIIQFRAPGDNFYLKRARTIIKKNEQARNDKSPTKIKSRFSRR